MTSSQSTYDLCVIGGGIHGAGIARDAAGRGLRVILLEKDDLASATSSASSKMLHGGLRYLEYYEFRLVREALRERETLLRIAPHIIRPMDFILPHVKSLRPSWMIRIGLFLYDHLAGRQKLKPSQFVDLRKDARGAPLKDEYARGYSYADGWMDDARLVALNAMDAEERGAVIKTRAPCHHIDTDGSQWVVHYADNGVQQTARADMIVNAAGPWVRDLVTLADAVDDSTPNVRLVKGSHIVVPRLYPGDQAYILQQPDRRVVFVWPYGPDYNYIGTTDVDFTGDPDAVVMDHDEAVYMCDAVNLFFRSQISPSHIVSSWSGVRTLLDDAPDKAGDKASAVTRDYKLVETDIGGAKMISVFGGKMTTYRKLSEKTVDCLTSKPAWTSTSPLPGGNISDMAAFVAEKQKQFSFLAPDLIARYAHTYGTYMDRFVSENMGQHFGDNVFEAEIAYLVSNEYARTVEDILWRRTKLGLDTHPDTVQNIETYLNQALTPNERFHDDRAYTPGH